MGGITAYIQGMYKLYRLQDRGGSPEAVVETCDSRERAEGNVRIYFGGGKGAVATGIRQA